MKCFGSDCAGGLLFARGELVQYRFSFFFRLLCESGYKTKKSDYFNQSSCLLVVLDITNRQFFEAQLSDKG